MRVSPCGFFARTEDEAKLLCEKVTKVTHNHPEGLKGAEATTISVFLARAGKGKGISYDIRDNYYPMDFTLDEIRDSYEFNETCQDTVPQAIMAFLESNSYNDAIRLAVSIGGDSDTLAAITGSIAGADYGIPDAIRQRALPYLDERLSDILFEFEAVYSKYLPRRDVLAIPAIRIDDDIMLTDVFFSIERRQYNIKATYKGSAIRGSDPYDFQMAARNLIKYDLRVSPEVKKKALGAFTDLLRSIDKNKLDITKK
jgi:hypothetical protein